MKNDENWRYVIGFYACVNLFSIIVVKFVYKHPSLKDELMKTNDEEKIKELLKNVYEVENSDDLLVIKSNLLKD